VSGLLAISIPELYYPFNATIPGDKKHEKVDSLSTSFPLVNQSRIIILYCEIEAIEDMLLFK
jgi:hypothetical protein